MQSRFTSKAQEALNYAADTAAMLGHGYIGSEHLLIGLIKADGFDESNIYQLMIGIHPANLLMISNKDMDEEELEVSRADFIREHLPTIH